MRPFKDLVGALNIFQLNLIEMMPLACVTDFNFYDFLMMRTMIPLVVIVACVAVGAPSRVPGTWPPAVSDVPCQPSWADFWKQNNIGFSVCISTGVCTKYMFQ